MCARMTRVFQSEFLHNLTNRMVQLEPYAIESCLTICSFWACFVLFTPPSNFETFPNTFRLAEWLQHREVVWAMIAGVAAILKLAGLATIQVTKLRELSIILRCFGLGMSGFFWTIMGVSSVVGNIDTLFGMLGLLMAFSAWWTLLRFPRFPEEV